jgi:ElaB/YqjD/DUF883 family membrane-anchored ribosome-binding protein
MDKIINWSMLLIIFVFDPLAIAMVVAANMAFVKIKPKNKVKEGFKKLNEEKTECSVPEGMEFGVSYPIKEHKVGTPEGNKEILEKLEQIKLEKSSQADEQIEVIKKRIEENKQKPTEKQEKLPKHLKSTIQNALKHAERRGEEVPGNIDRFFD